MVVMTNKENFTPLVGTKWTKRRMLKVHDMIWMDYLDKMLEQKRFSNKETIKRFEYTGNWIKHIRKLCRNNDIAFKKKDRKKKT